MKQKKIAFFYPEFFPVSGGSSVHGFALARGLSENGFKVYTLGKSPDGYTFQHKRTYLNVLRLILKADLVYLRMHLSGNTLKLVSLAQFFRKKIIVELNGPPDELVAQNKITQEQVPCFDKKLAAAIRNADAVITVSGLMKKYIIENLHYNNVFVIENGGERFYNAQIHASEITRQKIHEIKTQFQKRLIWSGTSYPWQGFNQVLSLAESLPETACVIIVSNDKDVWQSIENKQNIFLFHHLSRADVAFCMLNCEIGLALYGDFSWSRFKEFHGSSLKYFEYLVNGLRVIASPTGQFKTIHDKRVLVTDNLYEMNHFILQNAEKNFSGRTWEDVIKETISVMQSIN